MGFGVGIRISGFAIMVALLPAAALAATPRLDETTCEQLHAEQAKFIESGILKDMEHGAAWGKANLSAERLREVEHYILLDEQIKFGCRLESLTPAILHAAEIAKRLELNSDADPFAPLPEKTDKTDKAKKGASGKKQDAATPSDAKAAKAKPELPEPKKPAVSKRPPAAKPEKPALEKPAQEKNGSTAKTNTWSVEVKPRRLPKEADATPKKPSNRTLQELNWPPQFWSNDSATP